MGNWNRRYMPRKKYRQYDDDCKDPPRSYSYESQSSGLVDRRVPSWEIDYCHSARVPWNKILASKKYIYSYPSVLEWDGSAAEEALENAKQRFWAMINGLPCENLLPDPDMYISEIDWNPYMNPELMADLQDFNPDEAQNAEQLEAINEDVECARTRQDKNRCSSDNPWERDHVVSNESSKGWGTWGDVKAVSARQDGWGWGWEQVQRENYSGKDSTSKERAWRDNRNASWGGWSSRGGGRKRESSEQHRSKYKSSRYLGGFYGYGHQM